MKKIFLDANIMIDISDSSRPSFSDSSKLFNYIFDNISDYKVYTSCDLITTVYYILRKKLDKKNSLDKLKILNRAIHIIEFGNKEVDEAIYLMEKDKNFGDLEDTIQFIMARKERCDYIITNDKGFYSYEVPILSSSEALSVIQQF